MTDLVYLFQNEHNHHVMSTAWKQRHITLSLDRDLRCDNAVQGQPSHIFFGNFITVPSETQMTSDELLIYYDVQELWLQNRNN